MKTCKNDAKFILAVEYIKKNNAVLNRRVLYGEYQEAEGQKRGLKRFQRRQAGIESTLMGH